MAESSKYTYDEWVGQVRPDPRNTDPLTLLQGYLGSSSESGHIRVYSDETLNNFVEVPEDAIVYAQQLSQAESSLGGSKLWLRSDVVITYGDPKSANRPKTTFLEGDLMQQYTTQYGGYDPTGGMGAYGGGQPAGQGGQYMATIVGCPTLVVAQCPSFVIGQCPPKVSVPLIKCAVTLPPKCLILSHYGKSKCFIQTCFKTICEPTYIKPFCYPVPGGCNGFSVIPTPGSIACNPVGPVVQPGGFMGSQPDTTAYLGGYYGQFNPYTTMYY